MIQPLHKDPASYVTPDAEKPDLANGPFLVFNATNGTITYIQMTNDRTIWFKQVNAEGHAYNTNIFDAGCSELITDYFAQRLKEIEAC